MAPPKIKLYLDVVSPFGYIAYWILRNDPIFSGCEITYIPMFLGGVMKACGNQPPFKIKNKDLWIVKERLRWAEHFKVPMAETLPENFAPLTLTPMRALCALMELHGGAGDVAGGKGNAKAQEALIKAVDELMKAYWVEHRPIDKAEVVADVLEKLFGKEEAGRVMQMLPNEGKAILAANTDLALEDGAFGLPWIVATNDRGEEESFWGVDHLGQVVAHLGLEKPRTGGWRSLL